MPEPLVPFALYDRAVAIGRDANSADALKQMQSIIDSLPEANKNVLALLTLLLHRTAQYTKENLMSEQNLSIVIAPNIVRPQVETLQTAMENSSLINQFYAAAIANADKLFEDCLQLEDVQGKFECERQVIVIYEDPALNPSNPAAGEAKEKEVVKHNLMRFFKRRAKKEDLLKRGILKE
jgi:hypothetical protein